MGYGADPSACLEIVRDSSLFEHVILGNHDEAAASENIPSGYNAIASAALEWTASQLTREQQAYLADLSRTIPLHDLDVALVHSSLNEPSRWHYIKDRYQAGTHFLNQEQAISFCGHTHRPKIFHKRKVVKDVQVTSEPYLYHPERNEEGKTNERLLVNTGSVGQPRDGDAHACYVVLDITTTEPDTKQYSIQHRRVAYDIHTASQKIKAAGLPQKLADRLVLGM